ncbi:leucine-rich repeat neuronal protein 1-like [Haliotis asinina]|uniref:leucine-rich repeat neuronal protein 1-like n=1 Tax=Haliotis asinina TaxID=109174 RepID=UPI003532131A
MRPQGFLLAGALLMAASSLDMTQNHPTRTSCPSTCVCSVKNFPSFNGRLHTVNCSNRDLRQFPDDIPPDTEVLLFHHNNLRNLSHIPYLPYLKCLDLSYNHIRFLDNQRIYENVQLLKVLNLRGNSILKLQHGSFSGLKNLDVLDLSYNALRTIEIHAFGGLNHLQKFIINNNNLYELKRLWLQAMSSVTEIHMSNNKISKLEPKVFDTMPHLVHLDLSGNLINKIHPTSFTNVHGIKVLDLSRNQLRQVPKSVLGISRLQILLLDSNQLQRIETNDFTNSNITEISLSFQLHLRVIEKGAFTNLPRLLNLMIHDNPNLIFIHQEAFQNVSQLNSLFLHNNKLMAVSVNIKESLPSLQNLHLYHNPLHCDCNVYWIKKELEESLNSSSDTSMYIKEADKLLCDSPTSKSNMPLKQVPLSQLPPVCPPTTLPLFTDSHNITIGDDLYLECQAIGVPQPKIHWLLPDGTVLNSSMSSDRVMLIEDTAISVHGVRTSDEGTYACEAQNTVSYDISSTVVNVLQKDLKFYPISISNDYITLQLRGSIKKSQLSSFQLKYRESSGGDIEVVPLSARLTTCTLGGLKPLTTYEVCIVYDSEFIIHCRNITTKHELSVKQGITRITTPKIIAGVCTVLGVTVIMCCIFTVMKKLKKRKDYEDPEPDKGDVLSQIPLENLYQPPSTPLCTSRTALLPHSQI